MATPLRMPDLGTVEGQVTLVRWLKAEGETVALGEPLFEVETDKGVSEVEAALAGVLLKRVVEDGARVGAGEEIALIRRPGETEDAPAATGTRPQIAPTIRALAEKRGVDLESIAGTGPGGAITRQDVLRAQPAPASSPALPGGRNQLIVSAKVTKSHREKPVFHVSASVEMSQAIALHEKSKQPGSSGKVSYDAVFVKAAAMAIADFPVFQSFISGEKPGRHDSIDIAVAIGIGDDLYAPVVRAPAARPIAEVSRDIEELAAKAQAGSIGSRDVEGSCFLVSNLGMFPIESFDAVIYPEHSAALAVGSIIPTPVSDGTTSRIAPLAKMTLSVDHRLINGRAAAQLIARLKRIVETGALA